MYKNETIPEDIKAKYISELDRDPEKDFSSEFIRTTDLEAALLRRYGISGLNLVLTKKGNGSIYPLGEFPSNCPWYSINSKSHDEAIDTIFISIKSKIPNLISAMKERVRFIYVTDKDSSWSLNYLLDMKLYDGRDHFLIYSGGLSECNPKPNENLVKFDWEIPRDLKDFYAVHNGFGALGDSVYVLDSERISVMGEMMNPITKEQNVEPEGYCFNDLLEFFPDGAGNAQCFIRKGKSNNNTVDWDHEVWEISDEISFFEFIDRRMSELDEE